MPKSDRLEFLRRVETCRILMISGMPEDQIVQKTSQEWGVTPRQGWNYTRKAREKILAITPVEAAYLKAEHIAFRQYLRLKEAGDHNWQGALNVIRDEAKLLGLYPADALNVQIKDWRKAAEAAGLPPDMLNEIQMEFNAIIERALDRVGAGRDGTGSPEPAG